MSSEHGAEGIAAANDLNHAGFGYILDQLGDLEERVGSVWGRLADDRVASEEGGDDLAKREDNGEVPCWRLVFAASEFERR